MRKAHFALGIGLLGVGGHIGMTESFGAGSLSSRNQVFVSVPGRPVTANRCKVGIVARSERNSARHHVLVLIFKNLQSSPPRIRQQKDFKAATQGEEYIRIPITFLLALTASLSFLFSLVLHSRVSN